MACSGSKVSQVRIYSIKAEEDIPKVSDTTEAKAMLDTVGEFCNRFFSLLRCPISFACNGTAPGASGFQHMGYSWKEQRQICKGQQSMWHPWYRSFTL